MPFAAGVLISGIWPFGEAVCQMIAFFGPYVLYVSPVTMGFTAVNRYVRICKSNQQYKQLFSLRRSCISFAFAWILIACYILITRFTGLQGFNFEPGYAVCLNQHLNNLATIIHYVFVFGLFFILPMVLTIFSYRKVFFEDSGTQRGIDTISRKPRRKFHINDNTRDSYQQIIMCCCFCFHVVLDTRLAHYHSDTPWYCRHHATKY